MAADHGDTANRKDPGPFAGTGFSSHAGYPLLDILYQVIHTLEADGIQLNFGLRQILSDIYLKCKTREITGLLGRNGQGKSCLINILMGALRSPANSVRSDGKVVRNAGKQPHMLSYLPQFDFIPKALTVNQVLDDFRLARVDFETGSPNSAPGRIQRLATCRVVSGERWKYISWSKCLRCFPCLMSPLHT